MAKLAKIKTKENEASVEDFINSVADEQKRKDSLTILALIEKASKEKAKMWGASLIGFGSLVYKSPASGREVQWFRIGFSPRKANISLYLMGLEGEERAALLSKLGKHKTDGGCVYINKLDDVDQEVFEEMINSAVKK